MSQILINALTIQEINSALLRVQRSIKNNQASLTTNVTKIVSSGSSTIGGKYDDTAILAQINALSASLSQALLSVDKLDERVTDNEENIQTNANNIASLQSLLSNINFTYDSETNTIHFTDVNGDTTDIPLIDTTYDFAFDPNTHKLSVENNLSGETVFDSVVDTTYNFSFDTTTHKLTIHNNMSGVDVFDGVVDTVYSFSWNNGTLTITDNRSANPVATINFDNRYYTEDEIQALVLDLIPSQASSTNQLADKAFVNSSIETSTATFRGTFDSVAELNEYSGPVDNNDYAFVKTLDVQSGLYQYDRYKWVAGNPGGWVYEYTINSSGFTAEQLAALNSGITSSLVAKITDVYNCSVQINQNGTCKGSFTLNQSSNATISLTDQLVKQAQLTSSSTEADRNLLIQGSGTANNACTCIYVSCACPLTYNHKTGIIKSMNTDNWGSVYSGNTYSTGYYLLAQLVGTAATGNHDVTLYGTTFKNAAAVDYPTTFRVYIRGRCDTVNTTSFKVDNECNDIFATYEVDTTNHKFTLRLYGCIDAYYTKYNTQISYTASGDVSTRISTGSGCLTFPNTYFASLPNTETLIAKTPLTVMNSTCFGGCTYECAKADIRSGLISDMCFDVYCGNTCKCTITNGGCLKLCANAFNANAQISLTTYPGACCIGTLTGVSLNGCSFTVGTNGVASLTDFKPATAGTADLATNATCFGGCTYAQACTNIRSGLCSHDCLVKLSLLCSNTDRRILFSAQGDGAICPVYASNGVPFTYNACCGCLKIGDFSCNCCDQVYFRHNTGLIRSGPKGSQTNGFVVYKENNCLDNCSIGVGVGSGNINRGFFDYCKASETATTPTFRWLQYWDDTKEIHALPIWGELGANNKVVYSCVLTTPSSTRRYALVCFDKACCGNPSNSSACFEVDIYTSKYYIWIDVSNNAAYMRAYWVNNGVNPNSSIYGGFCVAYADTTQNGNCFWITYSNYRAPVIKSARKISIICNTTTAPSGITFTAPTNRNSYIDVYCGTTCVCTLQGPASLCLGSNAFNSTAFCSHDCLVKNVALCTCADRNILQAACDVTANSICPVYYSCGCSLTFNACCGCLKTPYLMLGTGSATSDAGIIYGRGTCASTAVLRFLNNTSATDGNGYLMYAGGIGILGAGEGACYVWCSINGTTDLYGACVGKECLYLTSDNNIYFYTCTQCNDSSCWKISCIDTTGTYVGPTKGAAVNASGCPYITNNLATSVKINGSDKTTISDVIATLDNTYQPKAYSFSCSSSHCRYIYLGSIPVSSGSVSYASLTMYLFGYNCQITNNYPIGTIQVDLSSGASATGFNIRGWSDIPLNSDTSNTNSPRLYVRKDTSCSLYRLYLDSAYAYTRPKIQVNWHTNFVIGDFKCYASMTGDALWDSVSCKDIVYVNKINRFDIDTDGNICCAGYICGIGGSLVNCVFVKAANTVATSSGYPVWRLIYDVTAWWNCAGTSSSNTSARGIVGRIEAYRNGGFGTSALVDIEAWTNYGRGSITNPLNCTVLKLAYCYKGTNIVQPYIIKNVTTSGDKYYLALKQCAYAGVPMRFDGLSYYGKWLTTQICGVDADGTLPECWSIAISPVQCSAAALELYTTTPFIDFHVGNLTCDYTHRIIASPGTSTTTYGCLQFITSCVSYNTSTCVYTCTEGNTFNMFPNGEFDAKFVKLGKGLATESAGRILAYGNKSTNEMICFLNNTNDVNGNGFSIGGGGIGIIGSGESANKVWCCINGSTNYFGACAGKEELYLASDGCITFITCANAADTTTWKYSYIDKDGVYHGDICGKSDCTCFVHQTAFTSADSYWNIPLWSNSETYLPYRCLGCLGSLKACQDSSNKVTLNSDYFCGTLCGLAGCFCRCAATSGTCYVALTGGTNAGCITGIWTSSACALAFAPATGQLSTTIGTFGSYTCAGSYMRAPIFMALGASGASKVCNVTIRACCTNASCTLTCRNWTFCGTTGDLWSEGYRTCSVSKSISFPKNATTYVLLGCFRDLQCNNENQLGIFASGSNLVNNGVLKWVGTNAAVNGQNNIELKMANYCNTSYGITGIGFIKTSTSWNCYTCVVLRICNANTSSDYSWVVGYFRNQIDCGGFSGEITCLGATAPTFDCLIEIPVSCRNFTFKNGYNIICGDFVSDTIYTKNICSRAPAANQSCCLTFTARCCNASALTTATMTLYPTGTLCVPRISNSGYYQKWQQTLNLSSGCVDCFYPVTWPSGVTYETDIEIQSPSGSGSMAYNQNYIHFYERASGWNDMPKTIYVQTLSRYQDSENVFGCIGYGTGSSSYSVIWLRGGMNYTVNANVALTAHTENVTCGTTGSSPSTYTVGTSLCGGTNTCVGVFANATTNVGTFSNQSTYGTFYNRDGCPYILKCEVDGCGYLSDIAINVYCGTTCKCTINNNGTLTLGSNAFNSTAFCSHDCLVKLADVSSDADRAILQTGNAFTAGCIACVYKSAGKCFTFNASSGVLKVGCRACNSCGCIEVMGGTTGGWFCTYNCDSTSYSMTANSTYYIKIGTITNTWQINSTDITIAVCGNSTVDKVRIHWVPSMACDAGKRDSITIDQANYGCPSGIRCVGWKRTGTAWNNGNDIYLVFQAPSTNNYIFSLYRNQLGGWSTGFSCTTTAPGLTCSVCTKPNGTEAFHWKNGRLAVGTLCASTVCDSNGKLASESWVTNKNYATYLNAEDDGDLNIALVECPLLKTVGPSICCALTFHPRTGTLCAPIVCATLEGLAYNPLGCPYVTAADVPTRSVPTEMTIPLACTCSADTYITVFIPVDTAEISNYTGYINLSVENGNKCGVYSLTVQEGRAEKWSWGNRSTGSYYCSAPLRTSYGVSCLLNPGASIFGYVLRLALCCSSTPYKIHTTAYNAHSSISPICPLVSFNATDLITDSWATRGDWLKLDGTTISDGVAFSYGYVTINPTGTNSGYEGTSFYNIQTNSLSAKTLLTISSIKCKKDVQPYTEDALCILKRTNIVNYAYKDEEKEDLKHVGVIAEMTDKTISGKNQDGLRISDSIGLLMEAVKDIEASLTLWQRLKLKIYRKFIKPNKDKKYMKKLNELISKGG